LERRLGHVVTAMLFLLDRDRNLQRRPDVAFVSAGRWAVGRRVPRESPWAVVPDLAIEVNSPSDRGEELLGKVREDFQAGARRVWVFDPDESLVDVDSAPTQVRTLARTEVLDDETQFPGFGLPLVALFGPEGDADAPEGR
jgi:Uma2 family endonuclease